MKQAFWLIMTGVAIGILLAPEKGSETLKKLVDRFNGLKDNVVDGTNDLVGKGSNMAKKAVNQAEKETPEWVS
jgi:gas vesicle protein